MASTLSAEDIDNVLFDTMCHLGISLPRRVFQFAYVELAHREGWNTDENCPIGHAEVVYDSYQEEGIFAEVVYDFCLTVLADSRICAEDVQRLEELVKYYTACRYAQVESE